MYEVKIVARTAWGPYDLSVKEFKTTSKKRILTEVRRILDGGYFLVDIDIWDTERLHEKEESSR
jgi:hypothetical protein